MPTYTNFKKTIVSALGVLPIIGPVVIGAWKVIRPARRFPGSRQYWENRYSNAGTSGSGSYGRLAEFKAEVINNFVVAHNIRDVLELGCGDGNQLKLAQYPKYVGLDVSANAVDRCRREFAGDNTKRFMLMDEGLGQIADLALSLDVIYHLIEEAVFAAYMRRLFESGRRYVIVYASNDESLNRSHAAPHVKHRKFSDWIAANIDGWKLIRHLPNQYPFDIADPNSTSLAEFFIYERIQ